MMAKIVYIADVCKEIFAGGDVPKSALSYEKTAEYNVPIFSNGEKNCGLYGYTNNARVKEPSITVSARGTIGYTAIRTEPFVPVVRLITLTPKSEVIDLDYLFYATQNYKFEGSGTSIPQLTVPMLKKYKFPLPEMSHQKAIAVKFEKLDQLVSLRKQQLAKLNELVKARFVEMFGEPVSNPMGWEKKKLQDVCYKLTDGTHFSPESYDKGDYKYITAKNIKSDGFDFSNITYVPESVHRTIYERCNPELGDVLYIKDGATTGIAMVNSLKEEFSLLSSVALLKQNRKVIDGRFLCRVLNNAEMYKSIRSNMGGAAITRLTIAKLQKIMVIVPPLPLQKQFAAFVKRVDQQKQTVQQSLEKLELMKKALMQEYFG